MLPGMMLDTTPLTKYIVSESDD